MSEADAEGRNVFEEADRGSGTAQDEFAAWFDTADDEGASEQTHEHGGDSDAPADTPVQGGDPLEAPTVPTIPTTGPSAPTEPAPTAPTVADGSEPESLLDEFEEPLRPALAGGRLTRSQLIAMGVGLVVTLAGVGWAVAAPSAAKPTPSASAAADPGRARKAGASIDELNAQVQAAKGVVAEFEAPLAAMHGASDEPARAAAESARQAYAQAVAAIVVPAKPSATADGATLGAAERGVKAGQDALLTAGAAFHNAISAFVGTMPGYAVKAVDDNDAAAEQLRTAVTAAAMKVASTDPFTPPKFAPWDSWRAALAALLKDTGDDSADQSSSSGGGSEQTSQGSNAPQPADPAPPPPIVIATPPGWSPTIPPLDPIVPSPATP